MSRLHNAIRTDHDNRQRGVVGVELLLVLPLLLFLFTATIEYSRGLQILDAAGLLAKEGANTAFRECRDLGDDATITAAQNQAMLNGCFAGKVGAPMIALMSNTYAAAVVIVSRYEWTGGAATLKASYTACPPAGAVPGFDCASYPSRYTAANVQQNLSSLLSQGSAFVVTEVFIVDGNPLRIFGGPALSSATYYKAAIV